jgi:hypothetical protein
MTRELVTFSERAPQSIASYLIKDSLVILTDKEIIQQITLLLYYIDITKVF